MDAREELGYMLTGLTGLSAHYSLGIADELFAAGYRKMPDREAIIRHLRNSDLIVSDRDGEWEAPMKNEAERMADAVLALMAGNK